MSHLSTVDAIQAIADYLEDNIVYPRHVFVHVLLPEAVQDTPAIILDFEREDVTFSAMRATGTLIVELLALACRRSNLYDDTKTAYELKDAIDIVLESAALQNKSAPCKIFGFASGLTWTCEPVIYEYGRAQFVSLKYTLSIKF